MSAEPEIQPSAAPLQFDRAVHVDPSAAPALQCARCTTPIAGAYYRDGDAMLCAGCGEARQRTAAPDRSLGTLVRAAVLGVGAAVLGALLYYGVMAYLELEIGIVAIAIGWLVGRAVARATRGRSARRHRGVALTLTYLSVAMAYAPFAIKEWKDGKDATPTAKAAADSAATSAPGSGTATAAARASADSTPTAATRSAPAATKDADALTAGRVALALLVVSGLLLALPVMAALGSMPGGLLSILIIGFGMRQAWTIAGASNAVVTGPYAIGDAAAA
jgi:hypothetical protein